VEASVQHPGTGDTLEYSIVLEVHDESGKVVSRHSLGVGAMGRAERRTFSLRVEMAPPVGSF
jgi:hypothetical protein